MSNSRRVPALLHLVTLLTLLFSLAAGLAHPGPGLAATPAPASVTIAGSLQHTLGCGGDWDPACAATHLTYNANNDVWKNTWTVPAGNYEYKAALNDSWNENYGLHAVPGGANIPLNLAAATSVRFYYDHKTHWVTDNVNSVIVTAAGSFQHALGCAGDWQPGCLSSWLEDPGGTGIYTFETTALPAGSYEAKAALNESWDVNYGAGGVQNGPNIPFVVPVNSAKVTFTYNAATHVLTVLAGHAHDNFVDPVGLRHDSRDLLYRTPGGAVTAGTSVTLRFRTFHNDVTSIKARIYSVNSGGQTIKPMTLAASDVSCYQADLASETCDYWAVTLPDATPDNLWYRFIITDGTKTVYYADDTPALDGGPGAASDNVIDNSWALTVYDPAFTTPDWAKAAVYYQIFPDRFRNGKTNNDPQTGAVRYDDPVLALPWNTLPEGYCRNYAGATPVTCPWRFGTPPPGSPAKESPRGRDYFGGDLAGVKQELAYLKSLGVTAIYLNPIFTAKSNHRYDTADYTQIDPALGTFGEFTALVNAAKDLGIKVVLDGVFNHMSSDSPFFDRYHHYATTGACEAATSPWRAWFTFRPPSGSEPAACVPSTPGGKDTFYNGWFGFDSIPVLTKSLPAVQQYFITAPDSISRYWLSRGTAGWRLDVMGDSSFPAGYWESFRQVVKQTNPDAVIIGELWQKDSTLLRFLRGDRADTTMDYRLRDAVVGFLAPGPFDSKGFADSGRTLKPSEFAARLASIQEDTPAPAYYTLMNLLDSHDTERLRWTLTPGAATTADKEQNAANVAAGKQAVRLASLIQFTLPGAPTVYYGDEVSMTGADDPDDRRTYPWPDTGGSPDTTMLAHYQALSGLRQQLPSLVSGDLRILLADDTAGTVAYGRKTGSEASLVLINKSAAAQAVTVPLAGYLPDGTPLSVKFPAPAAAPSVAGGKVTVNVPALSGLVLNTGPVNLTLPAAPSGLHVTSEGNAQIALAWNAVPGAAGYNVYASPLSGGGWVKANNAPLTATSFTVTNLRNAQNEFFMVTTLDAAGNESGSSNEASGMPHLTIGWANLQWPPAMTHTISVVNLTDTAYGQVWIDGVTNLPGPAPTLIAQAGFGPAGSNPAGNPAWTWVDAAFNVDAGNNDEYKAAFLPEAVGTYDYVYRYSTTAGRDWLYADLNGPIPAGSLPPKPGKLTVNPSGDTTPPATPTGLHVTTASPSAIGLAWDPVLGDPTLWGYEVLRGGTAGGPYVLLSRQTGTSYDDLTVSEGATYYYVVRSVDLSFNRSANSSEVSAKAAARPVNVVFNVAVPSTTDATGRKVYIAGTLSRLSGGLPDWNPGGVVLSRVDATHWTITLNGLESTQIEYKYTLGDWDHVEKDAACGEIANRQLTLAYGSTGTQTVNDTVLNWRNVAPCGN